jgi:ubiquitin C-terminal hydrolase
MNSGLQCLSNTPELTKYFCFNLWRKDVNRDNPLGMKGKLAQSYAELMLEMWKGTSTSTAPWEVKQMIGKKV